MFKPEEKMHLKNKVIIGINNFPKEDLIIFKNSMANQNIFNIDYIEINSSLIDYRIKNQREKANNKEEKIGMISKDWLNKYQNEIPSIIIQFIDITYKIIESKDPSLISEDIMLEIGKIKSAFMTSNYILIIKNLYKSNFDLQIKNNILNNIKYIKEKNVIIVNDNNQFDNIQFVDNLSELVKEEINNFYTSKKNSCFYKHERCRQKKDIEYSIKYLIKLFTLSYLKRKENVNYSYLFKANLNLRQKIDRKNYRFISCINTNTYTNMDSRMKDLINQIITYFEIRNISDYIIYFLSLKKNMTECEVNKLIYNHLTIYDINNFIKINNLKNINYTNNSDIELYYKYLFIFDLIWKISWSINKDNIIKKKSQEIINSELSNSNIVFDINITNYYLLNNLLRLYNFLIKEKDFVENIIINKYKDYKYSQIDNKFIEKIPYYFEIDENGTKIKDLDLQESIFLYMNIIILKNKDIIDINILNQQLQNFFSSQNYSAYLFNIIIKYNLIDTNNQHNKETFIRNSLSYLNNNKIIKFPKIYEIYLEKLFNLFVKEKSFEHCIEEYNKIEIILKYLSISKNKIFSQDENDLINDIINKKNENINNIYNFNLNNNNDFLDLQLIYKNKEISNECDNLLARPFDCLNITINLSIKKEDIFLDIEKIQIFFNSEMNSANYIETNNNIRDFKEIDISNKISKNNAISVNFNHFIKNTTYHYFFIDNIKIILTNKNIININNIKINNNIILYSKNNNEEKIIKLIPSKNINKNLRLGEKENYLHNIKYQKIIDNDNIIISEVSGKIELKENEIKEEVKKTNENNETSEPKYYLRNVNSNNNDLSNYSNIILFQENTPFIDKEIHNYNFIIKINEIGEYILLYNFKFKIIHKECNDESYIFEENGKIIIECLNPFGVKTELESSLYLISKDNQKTFPKNYPMKYNIILTNNLDKKMIIKNINFENNTNIKIFSPFLKINKQNNILLTSGDKFIIPCKLFINENIESSIGMIKIMWISCDLNEFLQKKIYNETIFELNKIITKEINFKIEGNFIYEKNNRLDDCLYYQLKIKNLNKNSKLLQCKLLNENNNIDNNNNIDDFNNIDIISYGKSNIKDIILPQKELIFLFLFYDINKMKNNNNEKIIIDSRYKSIIQINEYNLNNNNEKRPFSDLINQIFFIPELYSQFKKN